MAETVPVQCGACNKRFQLRTDQFGREVRCPHCKTVVMIPAPGAAAPAPAPVDPLAALGGPPLKRPAPPAMKDVAAALRASTAAQGAGHPQRPVAVGSRGLRSKNVAVVWAVLLVFAVAGVGVALYVVFSNGTILPDVGDRTGHTFLPEKVYLTSDGAGSASAAGAPGAAAPAAGAPGTPVMSKEAVSVRFDNILVGYKDDTLSYVAGHVRNNTRNPIKAIKISVELSDSENKKVGDASCLVLGIGPNEVAPFAAEWTHPEGQRAKNWGPPTWQINPPGVPTELPALVAHDPWPTADPNSLGATGIVKICVTNLGAVPVSNLDLLALLLDEKGKIVGVARNILTHPVPAKGTANVDIHWDHCAGSKVKAAEIWAQPRP